MPEKTLKTKGKAEHVDVLVAQQLKVLRKLKGYTQVKIADLMGVTFQQFQKYERGLNRISAGRLFELSLLLDESVLVFFKTAYRHHKTKIQEAEMIEKANETQKVIDRAIHDGTLIQRIEDTTVRNGIMQMVKNIIDDQEKQKGPS